MKEVSPNFCSAAVMIYCTSTRLLCKCTIAEKTGSAGSYWGEILGPILAQLILHAAVQGWMGPYPIAAIDCDNLGMVRHGNKPWRPLSTTQPQAEVLKILKQYIAHQPFCLEIPVCCIPRQWHQVMERVLPQGTHQYQGWFPREEGSLVCKCIGKIFWQTIP